jgi:hypothetical protein
LDQQNFVVVDMGIEWELQLASIKLVVVELVDMDMRMQLGMV